MVGQDKHLCAVRQKRTSRLPNLLKFNPLSIFMKQGLQIEEFGLMMLNSLELIAIDGGDTVNTSYYGGQSQLNLQRIVDAGHAVGDFFSGMWAGMTGH